MWAVGVADLGLSSQAFWNLTPYEFRRLEERFVAREHREDRRAALIACHIANYAGRMLKEGHQITIDEVLGRRIDSEVERLKHQTDIPAYLDRLNAENPESDMTYSKAVLDAAARGMGTWGKLGPESRAMQPVSIAKAMNPNWRPS